MMRLRNIACEVEPRVVGQPMQMFIDCECEGEFDLNALVIDFRMPERDARELVREMADALGMDLVEKASTP